MSMRLDGNWGGVQLRSPIMPASGTFSFEMEKVLDVSQLSALVLKTVTFSARSGNPVPRVSETKSGLLNSIGLPGSGIKSFIEHELPKYLDYGPPVIASVSADTTQQFAEMVAMLSDLGIAAIELNISCPNIEADGQAFAMSRTATAAVVTRARKETELPLWAKLTPNTGSIAAIAVAAQEAGADAVVVANTILALTIDAASRKPTLGNVMGGLSGPAIKPIILRMVYQCARLVTIPVIGCGGISSGTDVAEYLLAGASAVQIGTESFIDPLALIRIEDEFVQFCEQHNVTSPTDLVGALIDDDVPSGVRDVDVAP